MKLNLSDIRIKSLILVVCFFTSFGLTVLGLRIFTAKDRVASNQSTLEPVKIDKKLGVSFTVIDGTVLISKDNSNFAPAETSTVVQEGDYIKTEAKSRAALAFDDGSAIRLNAGSNIKLSSLTPENVIINNLAGEVYSRVVPSSRKFNVISADETYTALGTAFLTSNTTERKGVEVYHSRVKMKLASIDVPEGSFYYLQSSDKNSEKRLSELSDDQLRGNEFINWNYRQDKVIKDYSDKLGVLVRIDEKLDEKSPTPPNQPEKKKEPIKENVSPAKNDEPAKDAPSGSLTLTHSGGGNFSWTLSGNAPKGYKLVWSTGQNPTYPGSESIYFSSPDIKSGSIGSKVSGERYVRACIYTGDNCIGYSNQIKVNLPETK